MPEIFIEVRPKGAGAGDLSARVSKKEELLDRIDELVKLARAAVRVSEVDSIKAAVARSNDHLVRIEMIVMNHTPEKGSDGAC